MKAKIGILSLGCARNLVDSEVMLGYLKKAGFGISDEVAEADVAIVNTCSFIREAEEESIDAILNLGRLKKEGKIEAIIVCGCLAQRYKDKLLPELKEVDVFVGVGSIDKIAAVVKNIGSEKSFGKFGPSDFLYTHTSPRILLTPEHFAYVKISEGCNNRCSYCVIPDLRGRHRSRKMGSILKETRHLFEEQGVSEINLIGQDTTLYGQDLHMRLGKAPELIRKISRQAKGKWIRLLYAHPAHVSSELIDVIRDEPSVCKYIDLPIQHINDKILKRMNRRTSRRQILSLIEKIRKEIPGVFIRTTLMVGFPGETDKEFTELLDFIREVKFERLGLFKYSQEQGTRASNFARQIPEKIKQARYRQALSLQQDICTKINQGFLGKELCLLIDEETSSDKNIFLGRTEGDAPEVDGCVYVKSGKKLKAGDFVKVKITDTLEYDLAGEAL
ncbi:MAG: 30S ribosomal protein S12 methylthiotransferase RimO [Candidatus Omnitrophota bacterium]|nr:MAG: 30S ribosomal protein S12 methylthiotransferase RimO [Candidatus Omnitrophota bacterium]